MVARLMPLFSDAISVVWSSVVRGWYPLTRLGLGTGLISAMPLVASHGFSEQRRLGSGAVLVAWPTI